MQSLKAMVRAVEPLTSYPNTELAVVPASSSGGAVVYNYNSPLTSTVHHSVIRNEPTTTTNTGSSIMTVISDANNSSFGNQATMSGVNLIDTLRNVPRNPAFTHSANSEGQGRSSQPPQFQSNYTMKGKGKGRGAHIIPISAVIRPKGKVHSFWTDNHSSVGTYCAVYSRYILITVGCSQIHLILASPRLRASSRIFAEDVAVMKDQISWLDQQGCSRRVEN